MSQYDFGTIDPFVVDGEQLADMLNNWRNAIHSWHRGATRPAYIVPGMCWIDDSAGASAWLVKVYLSASLGDRTLFTYNTVSGAIAITAGVGNTFYALGLIASGAFASNPQHSWNVTDNPTDQKWWRTRMDASGRLLFESLTDAGVVQSTFTFNRDGTTTTTTTTTAAFNVRATTNDTLSGPGSLTLFRNTAATPVKDYDPDNVWSLASQIFTAPVAGRYHFHCQALLSPNAAALCGLVLTHRNAANTAIRAYGDYHTADASQYGATYVVDVDVQMAIGEHMDAIMVAPGSQSLTAIASGGAAVANLVWIKGHRIGN